MGPLSRRKKLSGTAAVLVFGLLLFCLPVQSRASTVGLILPKDCAFSAEVKDKFSMALRAGGVERADVLMQRPGSDKVSRLNSMRKFLAIGADVIVIWGATSLKEIAGEAGRTPIVFVGVWDPVQSGIIQSLQEPGKNMTGVMGKTSTSYLVDNILETTGSKTIGVLYHSQLVDSAAQFEDIQKVAPSKGVDLLNVDMSKTSMEQAFEALEPAPFLYMAQGCNVEEGVFEGLARMKKPAATQNPGVTGGGVIFTLAPDMDETISIVAEITGRILKGEKAGAIPVARNKKISFTINVGEARQLGVKIPFPVLNRGTEVVR